MLGSRLGDENYNADLDFNNDGDIDDNDLQIFVVQMGVSS